MAGTRARVRRVDQPDPQWAEEFDGRFTIVHSAHDPKAERALIRVLERHDYPFEGVRLRLGDKRLPHAIRDAATYWLVTESVTLEATVKEIRVQGGPTVPQVLLTLDQPADSDAQALALLRDPGKGLRLTAVSPSAEPWRTLAERVPDNDPAAERNARYRVDLENDGHDELIVAEDWPEGRYWWLLRFDEAAADYRLVLMTGDAA